MIYFDEQPQPQSFEKYYRERTNELLLEKDSLINVIRQTFDKTKEYEQKIDSLQKLKSKISYVYINKYKEVDSSYAVGVADKFTSIFAKSGIR